MTITEKNPWLKLAIMLKRIEQPARRFQGLFYRRENGSFRSCCSLCGVVGSGRLWEQEHRAEHIQEMGPLARAREKHGSPLGW